jgi:hypothetical protein
MVKLSSSPGPWKENGYLDSVASVTGRVVAGTDAAVIEHCRAKGTAGAVDTCRTVSPTHSARVRHVGAIGYAAAVQARGVVSTAHTARISHCVSAYW